MSVEKRQMIPSLMKILGLLLLFAVIVGCSDTQPTLTPEEINALIDAKIEGIAIDTIDSIYSIPAAVNAEVADSIVWIRKLTQRTAIRGAVPGLLSVMITSQRDFTMLSSVLIAAMCPLFTTIRNI